MKSMASKRIVKACWLIVLLIALTNCGRKSNEELAAMKWKYSSGFYLGDVLYLTTGAPENDYEHLISGDTIYASAKNNAEAIIVGTDTHLDGVTILQLRDPVTGEEGFYRAI